MTDLHVLEAERYYETLLRETPNAKKRIVIAAMVIVWGERTAPIFAMLRDALNRGVSVTILLDNYTRLSFLYGLRPRSTRSQRIKQTFETLEELSKLGAKVHCFGKIGIMPHKGRCHVKVTIIDDKSYAFGGVNFFDQTFDFTDFMLASEDPALADCLAQLVHRIGTSRPPLSNGEVAMGKNHTVLFDGGQPKRSIVYDKACELAKKAERIWYVSQMAPSGKLSELLDKKESYVYYNRPEQMMSPDAWGQAFDEQRYHTTNNYTGSGFIHAKFMLFLLPGNKKVLLCGSNNFSYRGVRYGTQEVGLYAVNGKLWDELHAFTKKYIAKDVPKP